MSGNYVLLMLLELLLPGERVRAMSCSCCSSYCFLVRVSESYVLLMLFELLLPGESE